MEKYEKEEEKRYYKIPKTGFWIGLCLMLAVIAGLGTLLILKAEVGAEEKPETYKTEHESLVSTLADIDECYLCGLNERSLMGYYRKFDTIGVIGLNEWCVIDLRLKEYDSEGNEITEDLSHNSSTFGNSQGVTYQVDGNPARGMSRASFSSDKGFDSMVIKENLCQTCLDKVTETLVTYQEKGKNNYIPFVLVDFETLDLYSMQKERIGYTVRDYWVSLDYKDEEIKVEAYYVPER